MGATNASQARQAVLCFVVRSYSITMHIIRDVTSLPTPPVGAVITLGNFDGIHLGHQGIIREVVAYARTLGGTPAVMTFDPPPARVLGKPSAPQLMTLQDRAAQLEALGVALLIVQTFTQELAVMEPERFVADLLERHIRPAAVFVGYDFCFGKERRGDIAFLQNWFGALGREVRRVGPLGLPGAPEGGPDQCADIISSSLIRRRLLEGRVEDARALLGRPHFLRGPIVHGDARGRTLGFPTANLASMTELIPKNGVYATRLRVEGQSWWGVTNVGVRPTFQGETRSVETHLLDFDPPPFSLYDREVALSFVARIRDEQRFSGLPALIEQIGRDIEQARRVLQADSAGDVGLARRSG